MRSFKKNDTISVHAIAGTEVILLGLDIIKDSVRGLLGFTISKRKGQTGDFRALKSGRVFKDENAGNSQDSSTAPIQSMLWSDYVVTPNTEYTYRIVPVYGVPGNLEPGKKLDVVIRTENPKEKSHAVYFNRGVAGSQAYSRRFGSHLKYYPTEIRTRTGTKTVPKAFIKPEDVPDRAAYKWLSRGLEEAMHGFIAQAKGPGYALRAAVYELTYDPVIQDFVNALERGADVKIIHHAKRKTNYLFKKDTKASVETTTTWEGPPIKEKTYKNRFILEERLVDSQGSAAISAVNRLGVSDKDNFNAFEEMLIERTITTISHNKFIVLLKNGKPIQVWTGSTNFTAGGIFGQSNVGHVVRDPDVAGKYFEYWKKLSTDPKKKSSRTDPPDHGMQNWTVAQQPDLDGPPPVGITPMFSPRLTDDMLQWYADRIKAAQKSVFFTAAFSVANEIFDIVKKKKAVGADVPFQRYLLLEGKGGHLKKKFPIMKACPQNRMAWGEILKTRSRENADAQEMEALTGLNSHVNFLHTKYMLVDPLSDDPLVISGSANFSTASSKDNDENMLIIRGNKRVADIFLGEFMRLFNHFQSRNRRNQMSDEAYEKASWLVPDDSWTKPYFKKGTQEWNERLLFSGKH